MIIPCVEECCIIFEWAGGIVTNVCSNIHVFENSTYYGIDFFRNSTPHKNNKDSLHYYGLNIEIFSYLVKEFSFKVRNKKSELITLSRTAGVYLTFFWMLLGFVRWFHCSAVLWAHLFLWKLPYSLQENRNSWDLLFMFNRLKKLFKCSEKRFRILKEEKHTRFSWKITHNRFGIKYETKYSRGFGSYWKKNYRSAKKFVSEGKLSQ